MKRLASLALACFFALFVWRSNFGGPPTQAHLQLQPNREASAEPAATEAAAEVPVRSREPVATAASPDDGDDSPRVLIRVVTMTARFQGEPVPNTRFAIGALRLRPGWAEAGESPADPGKVLFEGVTGDDGALIVELPFDSIPSIAGVGSVLWGKMTEPGFQQRHSNARLPGSDNIGDEPVQLIIQARHGATARGVLLDSAGQTTAGRISARLNGGANSGAGRYSASAGADGAFELHFVEDGSYSLHATGGELEFSGTAALTPVSMRAGDAPQDLELQLVGPGTIRGTVRDSQKKPAAGLEVLVLTAEADVDDGSFVHVPEISDRMETDGAGFYWRVGTTDEHGGFTFHGLRDDRFVVRARTDRRGGYPIVLTPTPVASDGIELDLHLLDRPHLVVSVRDENGNLLALQSYVRGLFDAGFAESWPAHPTLVLLPVREQARAEDARGLVQKGRLVGAEVVYDLPMGGDWLLTLIAPGCAPESKRVSLSAYSGRVVYEFVLGSPQPTGKLQVDVVGPRGEPVLRGVRLRVVDATTGACLVEREHFYSADDWPASFDLPAGEYQLVANSRPSMDFFHDTLIVPREHGDYRSAFTVRPDVATKVTAQLSGAARIELELAGTLSVEDRAFLDGQGLGENSWASRPKVMLRRTTGYPLAVHFAEETFEGTSADGTHLFPGIALGSRVVSEALPPGKYVLEIISPSGQVRTRNVVLVAGKTLSVRMELSEG